MHSCGPDHTRRPFNPLSLGSFPHRTAVDSHHSGKWAKDDAILTNKFEIIKIPTSLMQNCHPALKISTKLKENPPCHWFLVSLFLRLKIMIIMTIIGIYMAHMPTNQGAQGASHITPGQLQLDFSECYL